jgi:hypothetical protein
LIILIILGEQYMIVLENNLKELCYEEMDWIQVLRILGE